MLMNFRVLRKSMAGVGHIVAKICSKTITSVKSPLFQLKCARCLSASPRASSHNPHSVHTSYRHGSLPYIYTLPIRNFSGQKKNFFSEIVDNIKHEMDKNKQMKENLKKFREEAEKLEQSEALKKAREKYESIESETSKGSDALKKTLSSFQDKLKETVEEVEKSDFGKKGKEVVGGLGKSAQKTAESLSKSGEQISQTHIYRSVSQGVKAVREEIDEATARGRLYNPPKKLKTRDDVRIIKEEQREVEADTDTTGVTLHKDSKWFQSWQNFKDNNQFVHKMFDMKMKYDESENVLIRATRTFTDKMTDVFGGMFSKTEMSEVLTEIVKMDPTFDKEKFIKDCQYELIPNILEAMVRGDLEILKDWSYEAVYNTVATPIKQAQSMGYKIDSRVLDINHIDIVAGKMMEQGPVLVMSFNAQQVIVVRNANGKVMEGDEDKIMRVFHVWAFCRDQSVLDPKAAWRLIDMSSSPAEQWL